MGQALRGGPEGAALSAGPEAAERIGAYLARQRKLRGVSLDELESLTRIPKRSLERLESGVFDDDRDAFVRGFVRTVALALGLDAADAVARMLPEHELRRGARVARGRAAAIAFAGVLGLALVVAGAAVLWRVRAAAPSAPPGAPVPLEDDLVRRPNPVYELLPEWHARRIDRQARAAWEAQLAADDAARAAAEAAARARAESEAAAARAKSSARAHPPLPEGPGVTAGAEVASPPPARAMDRSSSGAERPPTP